MGNLKDKIFDKDVSKDILVKSNKGNELLYAFCSDMNNWLNRDYLSAQIWLIGRSYAASPERRSYKDGKFKPNEAEKGNGTDKFYDKLSEELLKEKEYKELIEHLKTLKDKQYSFTENDKDVEILKEVIMSVITFNRLLRIAVKNVDKTDNDSLNNFISFSSKFLHFYVPNVIYIIDSFSSQGLNDKALNQSAKNLSKKLNIGIEYCNEKEKGQEYIKHCCKAYLASRSLQEKFTDIKITPRVLDNYLLYYISGGNNQV